MTGKAALLAEPIDDKELFTETATDYIIDYFDKAYKGFLDLKADDDYQKAFYDGQRERDETLIIYIQRKLAEIARFEAESKAVLPDLLKGKMLLRHAELNEKQQMKVSTWLAGARSKDEVVKALGRLDTDESSVENMVGKKKGNGNYWGDDDKDDEEWYHTDNPWSGGWPDKDDKENPK